MRVVAAKGHAGVYTLAVQFGCSSGSLSVASAAKRFGEGAALCGVASCLEPTCAQQVGVHCASLQDSAMLCTTVACADNLLVRLERDSEIDVAILALYWRKGDRPFCNALAMQSKS